MPLPSVWCQWCRNDWSPEVPLAYLVADGGIVDPDGRFVAWGGETAAVGTPGHRPDEIAEAVEGEGFLAGGGVPYSDGTFATASCQALAVGAPRHRVHRT